MNKNLLVTIVVIAIIILGLFLLLRSGNKSANQTSTGSAPTNSTATNLVTYTDNGFSPKNIIIKPGETVTFENKASDDVQVQSDPHPIHNLFPMLNIGLISPNQEKTSSTFPKVGTYTYHNHLNPSEKGTVTAE